MSQTYPGVGGGDINLCKRKEELRNSLDALCLPNSTMSQGSPSEAIRAMTIINKNAVQWRRDLSICREEGGSFKCAFRAGNTIDKESITITRQGRLLISRQDNDSVVLADELTAIRLGTQSSRWSSIQALTRSGKGRASSNQTTSFELTWVKKRTLQEKMKALVFVANEDAVEFEAVVRAVISRYAQCSWRQSQYLAQRCIERDTEFNPGDSLHRAALIRLWRLCYPNFHPPQQPLRDWEGESEQSVEWDHAWMRLGFVVDLQTSFEGSGILGLKLLIFFGQYRTDWLRSIMGASPGDATLHFATIGLTVVKILIDMNFDTGARAAPLPNENSEIGSQSDMARLLLQCQEINALELFFCQAFGLALNIIGKKFNNDMHRLEDVGVLTQKILESSLAKLPTSLNELAVMISLD